MKANLQNLGAFANGVCPDCKSPMFLDLAGSEDPAIPTHAWLQCENHASCGRSIPVRLGAEIASVSDALAQEEAT